MKIVTTSPGLPYYGIDLSILFHEKTSRENLFLTTSTIDSAAVRLLNIGKVNRTIQQSHWRESEMIRQLPKSFEG